MTPEEAYPQNVVVGDSFEPSIGLQLWQFVVRPNVIHRTAELASSFVIPSSPIEIFERVNMGRTPTIIAYVSAGTSPTHNCRDV